MQRLDFDPLNPPPAGQVREQAVGATAKRANGDGSLDGDEARLAERIVALSRHEYEKGRKGIAKEEGVTVRYLDGLREFTSRSAEPESPSLFPKVDPWPEPVAGAELLDLLRHSLERFVVFTEYGAATVALWVLAAWSVEAFLIAPYLAIISPEKRCGKTTLMEILGRFVPLPLKTSNITPAALFRAVEKFRCSLLIDEADSFLDRKSKASGSDELRGILNAGHSRASAYVIRTVGEDHEPVVFNVFGPKAIACIGQLPDTIEDRSIVIRLRRRGAGEKVERHRIDRGYEFAGLARKCARWAQDHVEALRAADPETPAALHDRAADNWRPLLAVANAAGGAWLRLAVAAAKGLTETEDAASLGVQLLADIREIFARRSGSERISGKSLIEDLVALEERPWGEISKGKPITPHRLARMLKPFGVGPRQQRTVTGVNPVRGYHLEDFHDPFARYLGPVPPLTEVVQVVQPNENKDLRENQSDTNPGSVPLSNSPKCPETKACTTCTTLNGGSPSANTNEPPERAPDEDEPSLAEAAWGTRPGEEPL